MIVKQGKCSGPWYLLEMNIQQPGEGYVQQALKRLLTEMPDIFGKAPFEVFIPVMERDLGVFELASGPYIYVRGDYKLLMKLKSIHDFQGLLKGMVNVGTAESPNWVERVQPCDDSFVQELIEKCKQVREQDSVGIKRGSFVRLIDGECSGFCGHVAELTDNTALVNVEMETRRLLVSTPLTNLKNLPDVPKEQQKFFYNPRLFGDKEKQYGNERNQQLEAHGLRDSEQDRVLGEHASSR